MDRDLVKKYKPYNPINLHDRNWPNRVIDKIPRWCSVDLRDGNQALIQPMGLEEKVELFQLLLKIGFKEIEVGFPSASETEFGFLRHIIEKKMIPDDITIQVLTQAREHLILKTFDALKGVKKAIVHLYNSTSTVQRKVVFQKDKKEIKQLALEGVKKIQSLLHKTDTEVFLEYSPESFTGTELDFALDICETVMEEWGATSQNPVILNLPATVELSTPNIYADQIEWFIRGLKNRNAAIISLHTHNDRGTGVAATELGLMAGADRVEGTLFGNGERTGNVDIVTLALNLYTQGLNPNLDFHNINEIIEVCERCTKIPLSVRHPYAGDLVYTAFSGSHQDAISKGMKYSSSSSIWEVPYLPIDPTDLGRNYESIIRINSQSGKGGVAYILSKQFGFEIPKKMQPEVSSLIQKVADDTGEEINSRQLFEIFKKSYFDLNHSIKYISSELTKTTNDTTNCILNILFDSKQIQISGNGSGPLAACIDAFNQTSLKKYNLDIISYHEHALQNNTNAEAVSYLEISDGKSSIWGCGLSKSITTSSIKSLISALNRLILLK